MLPAKDLVIDLVRTPLGVIDPAKLCVLAVPPAPVGKNIFLSLGIITLVWSA